METREGATVGAYEVKSLVGKGGMGEVYMAEHTLLGRKVAIKFLLPSLSADEELVERFFTEAKATTSVNDPGIVQIFDFGYHTDGAAYIVMEFLEGEALDSRLAAGLFDEDIALHIARHLANSLHAAHRAGVIHRDLKLENVFMVADPAVTGGERPKILDFGLAKLSRAEPSRSKTRTGAIMGTPIYMSPEQCKGAHDVDERSDLYSLGCLLYCTVLGRPPFDYGSAGELIAAHLREEPPIPSQKLETLSADFDRIMARCLAKDPAARYQSMNEMSSEITAVLGDGPNGSRPGLGSQRFARIDSIESGPTRLPTRLPTQFARPTTLSTAVGLTAAQPVRKPRRLLMAIGGLLIAAAAGAGIMRVSAEEHSDRRTPTAAIRPQAAPQPAPLLIATPVPAPIEVAAEPTPVAAEVEIAAEALATAPVLAKPARRGRAHRPARPVPTPAAVVAAPKSPAEVPGLRAAAGSIGSRGAADMDRGD